MYYRKSAAFLLACLLLLTSCSKNGEVVESDKNIMTEQTDSFYTDKRPPNDIFVPSAPGGEVKPEDDDVKGYGEKLEDLGVYGGAFEGDGKGITLECLSGIADAYTLENGTLTFSALSEDTVYSISGELRGNIVIDAGDEYKLELEMCGFSLISEDKNPIVALSGSEVKLSAKKDTKNYIYDNREAIDKEDETLHSGAVHSEIDLEMCGKGELFVVSKANNGIHTKDDLQLKNLTLTVACVDNALKGNDSVSIESGSYKLIASGGDCIKTTNSNISEKGKQRGSVVITGGTIELYAACDGIDSAYDVNIDGDSTKLSIYTDKYSNYSGEVTATEENLYYIRFNNDSYTYSVRYYNSEEDTAWVSAEYHSKASGGRSTYYYYSFPKMSEYSKMQVFVYSSDMEQGQDDEYLIASELLTPNIAYDTFALSNRNGNISYNWTNYTTSVNEGGFGGGRPGGPGGPGGMGEGNKEKGEYSTKGIKAANEITINSGTVNIKSYDDALHANNDVALENGETALGALTVNGGNITLYSNDDGLHADGTLTLNSGNVSVSKSYEGAEGTNVVINGGKLSIISSDDGINATATSGTAISITGGEIYIYCTGDGIDSNSRSSYEGIIFSGGRTVVISNSGGNSSIDSEQGYSYTGGSVIALMPRGGMSREATNCKDFASVGYSGSISLSIGAYLCVTVGDASLTLRMPCGMSAMAVVLGDTSPKLESNKASEAELNENGIAWN
jgi:hypothetical protein